MRFRFIVPLLAVLGLASPASAQIGDFANGAMCAVSPVGYDASATSIAVVSGCGARFPTVPFYAVWWNQTDYPGGFDSNSVRDPNYEVVRVTGRSSDTLTVTRAIEGGGTKNTSGKTYFIVASATAQTFDDINTALGAPVVVKSAASVWTNEYVLTFSKGITVESPGSAEDMSMFFTDTAITVTKMVAVMVGSSPSVTWTIRHSTDRNATGNQVVTGGTTTTSTTTGSTVTSFNDATIPANSFVWLETTAKSGTVTSMNITIFYTVD